MTGYGMQHCVSWSIKLNIAVLIILQKWSLRIGVNIQEKLQYYSRNCIEWEKTN